MLFQEVQAWCTEARPRGCGGVWPVYWSWGDLTARYPSAAALSTCWGQASLAINNMLFLRAFSRV